MDHEERLKVALADRYQIEREIGSGGMATVYLARDLRHDRQVALKVLRPDLAAVMGVERFLAEIRTTANLQHPHILPLHDSGEEDGLLFYVMPFVQGESLRQRLDREGPLPIAEAVRIATQLADALSYAHRKDVIHRDVKPANILFLEDQPLVADFGIALAVTAAGEGRLTETGISLGTPQYMSPEQAMGQDRLTPASDIYSLGAVVYEMLTGEPPHTGASVRSVIAKLISEDPTHPRTLRPSISQGLNTVVMRALAKLPVDRFQEAGSFARSLEDGLRDPAEGAATRELPGAEVVERRFSLTASVCRQVARDDLDPRMIGDHLLYLDNQVPSDVLVVYLHGFGGDHQAFQNVLESSPYRSLAVTLFGFEPAPTRRIVLSQTSHCAILRGFLSHLVQTQNPRTTILIGFSSGADLGFSLINSWPADRPFVLDGYLSIGCNLNLDTCFVSGVFAGQSSPDASEILPDLRSSGARAETLEEWLNIHEYLVYLLRKFQADLTPLRIHGEEIVAPFRGEGDPFPGWFRSAGEKVNVLRCVFADTEMESKPVKSLLIANLDSDILGDAYREDSIQIEPGADHFDLILPARINRHLSEMVQELTTVSE
jgi:serine/threonine protein kinase